MKIEKTIKYDIEDIDKEEMALLVLALDKLIAHEVNPYSKLINLHGMLLGAIGDD